MTVKIFCCSDVKKNGNIHTHSCIQKWKNWTPRFWHVSGLSPGHCHPSPSKSHTPTHTYPHTHTQKTYKYSLSHTCTVLTLWQQVVCDTSTSEGSLADTERVLSSHAPVAQIYHWDSLMAAFVTYYCFIFSSPSPSPQKFLFCSYF